MFKSFRGNGSSIYIDEKRGIRWERLLRSKRKAFIKLDEKEEKLI